MKKVVTFLIVIIVLGVLSIPVYYLYQKSKEKPVVYSTVTPERTTIIKKTVATGSVVPRKEIEIKPVVSGIIDKLYVEPGDEVKKGDLIARVQIIPDMIVLNNAENRLSVARINLKNAKADYERNKKLFDDKVIPAATYQQFEIAFKNAKQELNAAKDNLDLIKKGSTSRNTKTSNTLVRSTIAGTVLDVPVEEGNAVIEANNFNEGTTIASVADMADLIFEGKVDESEVGKIQTGMELILTIAAIDQERFTAILEYISPKGVEEEGAVQFEIKADVKLKEGQFIRAGYSANADIVLDRADSVLTINESLLIFEEDKTFVEVKEGDSYKKVEVQLGLSDGIKVEVKSGLNEKANIKDPNSAKRI